MRIVALGLLCAWLAIAAHTPARGQWQRIVLSGKGEFDDIASPHPLSYFTRNSFLRDDSNEFCISCTPDDKAGSGRKYSVRTAINPVGTLADFPVVDLLYSITARNQPSGYKVTWKSILVQVSRDSYREIFHLQAFYTTASLKPSRIIQSGNEKILATVDSDGGNAGNCWEHYWWFDRSGPHSLNFRDSEPLLAIKYLKMPFSRFRALLWILNPVRFTIGFKRRTLDATHATTWAR